MSVWQDDTTDVRQFLLEQGQTILWKPRYTAVQVASYGLADTNDPHAPQNPSEHCPVCYNATLQRPASSVCTTCYGTGWPGGFAGAVIVPGVVALGRYLMRLEETGELVAVDGEWLYTMPADATILPQDLIQVGGVTTVRYLVGQEGSTPGTLGVPVFRVNQLLPVAPDNPLQHVPLT